MEYIKPLELRDRIASGEKWTVIDIREGYELDICSVNFAVHIPMAEVAERIAEIPEDGKVAIMCKSGRRAMAVTNLLIQEFSRENVLILEGGILAWAEEVEPHLETY